MDNHEMLEIALRQSALEMNCEPKDFFRKENIVTVAKKVEGMRSYAPNPFICNLVSYGTNIVATAKEELIKIVEEYINSTLIEHCFETPTIYQFNEKLKEYGYEVTFMSEYFLLDTNYAKKKTLPYEMRILTPKDFEDLYLPQWSNALCENRKHLDVLGIGAYDKGKLVGFAGCSKDCESMWQIGIDVLPEYRRQGIATALTSNLALEIMERGKVPFYCAAWSNVKSVRNAILSGFRPAWVELAVSEVKKK